MLKLKNILNYNLFIRLGEICRKKSRIKEIHKFVLINTISVYTVEILLYIACSKFDKHFIKIKIKMQ